VKLLALFESETSIFMVLEYQPNGTLMTVLENNGKGNNSFSEL
jgi:serine/threonine protein kinase